MNKILSSYDDIDSTRVQNLMIKPMKFTQRQHIKPRVYTNQRQKRSNSKFNFNKLRQNLNKDMQIVFDETETDLTKSKLMHFFQLY